jgi:hypothetical protein
MGPGSRVYSGASAAVETLGRDDSQFRIRASIVATCRHRRVSKDEVASGRAGPMVRDVAAI